MKRIAPLLLVAGAACAAPAMADTLTYATGERVTVYQVDPATGAYVEQSTTDFTPAERAAVAPAPVAVQPEPAAVYYVEPATASYAPTQEIIVTAPRRTEDQLINDAVVDRIASDPRISGKIGVETSRNEVTLSGQVNNSIQADRAARHARSTPGVREVNNELRSRMTF